MRKHYQKRRTWARRMTVLLLLCGLLLSAVPRTDAATVTYKYDWINSEAGLPTDGQWHDYFIAWEDLDDKNKVWFADYHWFTADGYNNYDAGGSHWMEYKAASTLPDHTSRSFTSREGLGHMQIKYAGRDEDNNSPMYYIRVSKMHGGYVYFTEYEPTSSEDSAEAFTFQDKGDVFHIFVNISGKADRYLTRDGQNLETTESSSYGGGEYYRPLRVYQRTFTVNQNENDEVADVIGKVTLYEYSWVNTTDEMLALGNRDGWSDVVLAWEDADGGGTTNPDKVWYTKEVWYEDEKPNYENGSFWEGTVNEYFYWSNDYWGTDGYSSPYADAFILPNQVGHFQVKRVGWDDDNPVSGYTDPEGKTVKSPVFHFRFDIGRGRYVYIGNNYFYDDADDAEGYTAQLRLGRTGEEDLYGSVWLINNMTGEDEMITRKKNRFDVSNWGSSGYWEFPFRIYTYQAVEYDAIVKSFAIGKGATYSIDRRLILDEGVTITVEDGGVLMVDNQLLSNGHIVVKNGGTVIVNEGGYIMAYNQKAEGKITLDGGNLIILDGAKVICDEGGGTLQADNGSTILNRGLLMVGDALTLNGNSCLKNEASAMLVVGGDITRERGSIDAFNFSEITARVSNANFTYICAGDSRIVNKGIISEPGGKRIQVSTDVENSIRHIGDGRVEKR